MTPTARTVGSWRISGEGELFEVLREDLERAADAGRSERGVRSVGGIQAYLKGSALRGKHALRHAVRQAFGLAELPRLQEFANLTWLREHGFLAPRPLAAGVRLRHGVPCYQFLCSEFLPETPTLEELFTAGPSSGRRPALEALALDLARLHALGFVHRDLFPRNLLVCSGTEGVRVAFIDSWRGAPGRGWRGPGHDLGCLFLDGASLFEPDEQRLFLRIYAAERSRSGAPTARNWPRQVTAARLRIYRRESRRRQGLLPRWDCPPPT